MLLCNFYASTSSLHWYRRLHIFFIYWFQSHMTKNHLRGLIPLETFAETIWSNIGAHWFTWNLISGNLSPCQRICFHLVEDELSPFGVLTVLLKKQNPLPQRGELFHLNNFLKWTDVVFRRNRKGWQLFLWSLDWIFHFTVSPYAEIVEKVWKNFLAEFCRFQKRPILCGLRLLPPKRNCQFFYFSLRVCHWGMTRLSLTKISKNYRTIYTLFTAVDGFVRSQNQIVYFLQ